LVIGSSRSRKFFKIGNWLWLNFDIMVTGNRFLKDILKTITTVKHLKADDKDVW
jgi:hypothetical protein